MIQSLTRSPTRRGGVNRFLSLALAAVFILSGTVSWAANANDITEAERRVFMDDHLASLPAPTTLHYLTERRGSLQDPLDDKASVELQTEDGRRVANVQWMSGREQLRLPPFDDVKGNPILLYFLEREIREMNRLTGGSMNYYRKRIRMALASNPGVEATTVDFAGRQVKATRITISPFVDDPARSRYEKFADRRYTMILSDDVPGAVVSVSGELRGSANPSTEPTLLWSESVRLDHRN